MTRKGISLCIFVILFCIGIEAWAGEKSPNRIVSEKLIASIDSSSWIPESLKVSPDSRRVAYVATVGNKWSVVLDGKGEKQYDGIMPGTPIFSPDSRRVAYAAQEGDKFFVVIDGKEDKQYDGIAKGILFFSPGSKRVAYAAQEGDKQFVVVDGKEGKQYDGFLEGARIIFDSPHTFHYLAIKVKERNNIYLVEEKIQ